MKKIVCELCEGMQFDKIDGRFICKGCGTSYPVEEARAMMREVEDGEPVATGDPTVNMPQVSPNHQQLDNILLLASSAYEADNKAEAENYCNQAIVLDAMCYKAWFLKGKAVGWQSKIDSLRIEEAAHSFCKAIDFAPEEEKEHLKDQATEELKNLGLALVSLRKQRFSDSPDKEELNGFTSAKKVIVDSLMVLLSYGNAVSIPEGFLEEVANEMNLAGVAALNMARKAWANVDHPGKKDFDIYLDWNMNICEVFRQAIDTSDDDNEEDITRYENLIIALKEPFNAYSYKEQWDSYWSRYDWVVEYSLAQSAKDFRNSEIERCEYKIKQLKKAIKEKKEAEAKKDEEEKKARIDAYWEAHAEEKAALDAELKALETKRDSLSKELSDIEGQIKVAELTGKVPSEEEHDKIVDQIRDLNNRRASLGIFAGKEKKQIGEEIASLEGRKSALAAKIEGEKKARKAESDLKLAPLKTKKKELSKQKNAAVKRITAINKELTKDPEE